MTPDTFFSSSAIFPGTLPLISIIVYANSPRDLLSIFSIFMFSDATTADILASIFGVFVCITQILASPVCGIDAFGKLTLFLIFPVSRNSVSGHNGAIVFGFLG